MSEKSEGVRELGAVGVMLMCMAAVLAGLFAAAYGFSKLSFVLEARFGGDSMVWGFAMIVSCIAVMGAALYAVAKVSR